MRRTLGWQLTAMLVAGAWVASASSQELPVAEGVFGMPQDVGGGAPVGDTTLPDQGQLGAASGPGQPAAGPAPRATPLGIPTFNESYGVQDFAQGIDAIRPGLFGDGTGVRDRGAVNQALNQLNSDQLRTLLPGVFAEDHRVGARLREDGTLDAWTVLTAGDGRTNGTGAVWLGQRIQDSNPQLANALVQGGRFAQQTVPDSDIHLGTNLGFAPATEGQRPQMRVNGATVYLGDLPGRTTMNVMQDGRVWVGAGAKEVNQMMASALQQSGANRIPSVHQSLPLGNQLNGSVSVGNPYVTTNDTIALPIGAHFEARKDRRILADRVTTVNGSAYPQVGFTDRGDQIEVGVNGQVGYTVTNQNRVLERFINGAVDREVSKATQGAAQKIARQLQPTSNPNDPRYAISSVRNGSYGQTLDLGVRVDKSRISNMVFGDRDMTVDSVQLKDGRLWAGFGLPNDGVIRLPQ